MPQLVSESPRRFWKLGVAQRSATTGITDFTPQLKQTQTMKQMLANCRFEWQDNVLTAFIME